ncbi:hypothetical protein [Microbacterium sp. ZW T5_56]|uniref:hypothetical protein n=1 Tax=Microbacterium sp. ZW T5_56 TaxID=3378081 RepID=UPI003854A994
MTTVTHTVERLLPAGWSLTTDPGLADARADVLLTITSPSGERARFAMEMKLSGGSVSAVMAQLRERRGGTLPLVYVSSYLGPSLREALDAENISYADGTGWLRLVSESPLVLLTGRGADRAPQPTAPASITRLNGIAASRIIRTLAVSDIPIGVRDLAMAARVSPGSVSKLLPTLTAEGIIDRPTRTAIIAVRRRALIVRWTQDYAFAKTNPFVGSYLAPRGIERTLSRLGETTSPVTLTGSAAAHKLLPDRSTSIVPLRLASMYSADPAALARELTLVPADRATANVMVAVPQDAGILDSDIAPMPLVLADLLTLPGRGDAEATQLMDSLPGWES